MAVAHARTLASLALVLATVFGRVVDEGHLRPLPGVRVHAEGPTPADTTTDRQGKFSFNGLAPGSYVVTAQSTRVPAQIFVVQATTRPAMHLLRVCTVEDDNCGPPPGGGGHP